MTTEPPIQPQTSFIIKPRTLTDQEKTEKAISEYFQEAGFSTKESENFKGISEYFKEKHFNFGMKMLHSLPGGYTGLDSGYPWLIYWVTNIIEMTKEQYDLSIDQKLQLVKMLKELKHPEGGFCGCVRGHAHLISTYAAVMAILNLGIKEAYEIIDIKKMKAYLLRMKNNNFNIEKEPSSVDKNGLYLITRDDKSKMISFKTNAPGTFMNHISGESDLRSTYCAITVAYILNLLDLNNLEGNLISKGVVENIKNCQNFEGGLGPEPFCEAHGGYSFCGIATLVMLNKLSEIDVPRFVRWLTARQMKYEGGFNGRTNKLVDSCYSYWQGSIFNMLMNSDKTLTNEMEMLFDQLSLQAYILFACQNEKGGLKDKPGKPNDLFHTNYASLGFILSQESLIENNKINLNYKFDNMFPKMNPIFGVRQENVDKALTFYKEINKK